MVRQFWRSPRFDGFGRDLFSPSQRTPRSVTLKGKSAPELKRAVQASCQNRPGVYGMLDAEGQLIYVGKSKRVRTRLLSYFLKRSKREKAGTIIRETNRIVWESQSSEFAALLRELYLIRTWRPRWNVKDQPKARRPVYVCVGRSPAAYVFATTDPPKNAKVFGPFQARGRVHSAVDTLNQHYGLRDCSSQQGLHFSDQPELFYDPRRPGCLRFELQTCLGPCVGGCSQREYAKRVERVVEFLKGDDDGPVVKLRERMERAALEQRYETAGRLRDRLADLEWLARRLDYLQEARAFYNFIYPVRTFSGRSIWYAIHQGCVATSFHPPGGRRGGVAGRALLENWQSTGRLDGFPIIERHPTISLLSHWFRTRAGELERVIALDDALARFSAVENPDETVAV